MEPSHGEQLAEPDVVLVWRADTLIRLGVEHERAFQIAENSAVDVHEFESLVARGATLELAERILR
jgi:hypothetical protein